MILVLSCWIGLVPATVGRDTWDLQTVNPPFSRHPLLYLLLWRQIKMLVTFKSESAAEQSQSLMGSNNWPSHLHFILNNFHAKFFMFYKHVGQVCSINVAMNITCSSKAITPFKVFLGRTIHFKCIMQGCILEMKTSKGSCLWCELLHHRKKLWFESVV